MGGEGEGCRQLRTGAAQQARTFCVSSLPPWALRTKRQSCALTRAPGWIWEEHSESDHDCALTAHARSGCACARQPVLWRTRHIQSRGLAGIIFSRHIRRHDDDRG